MSKSGQKRWQPRSVPEAESFDVVIVGAGAAGVGVGVCLQHAGIGNFVIVDRHHVGASFERWPAEMKFITPSFPTNSIGMLDLNAVAIGTSPAHRLKVEHPGGRSYAVYLKEVAAHFELPVRTGVEVTGVVPGARGFLVKTRGRALRCRFVIWAAGEFQYPGRPAFPGAELCRHNATVESWQSFPEGDVIIIGGYESGMDAAVHLARCGHPVTVIDRDAPWRAETSDPSVSLSTFTQERLHFIRQRHALDLIGETTVTGVEKTAGGYRVLTDTGTHYESRLPPVLATGFEGSLKLVKHLFELREDGYPLLSDDDESTTTPGLFVCGPMVRHENHVFCFIYKFRQRFAVVAKKIATQLGLEAEELEGYRDWGMYLDDLSCCGEECVC